MTRLEKLIELVKSSQLVTKKISNKSVLVGGEKTKTNKITKNQTKGIWQKMKK